MQKSGLFCSQLYLVGARAVYRVYHYENAVRANCPTLLLWVQPWPIDRIFFQPPTLKARSKIFYSKRSKLFFQSMLSLKVLAAF